MTRSVQWTPAYRIVRSIFPPIDIFEDIADPADWDLLASSQTKLNPRLRDAIGTLALVPASRRVSGPTASIAMGAFTHVSLSRPSRFSDGAFGVWYCGDRLEVALSETAYHFERFMRASDEPPADAEYRLLTCAVAGRVAVAPATCLHPSDWNAGQRFGPASRASGQDGVLYRSVRYPAGQAAALFWPDCLSLPIQFDQRFRYRWDGLRMTHYLPHHAMAWSPWPIAGAVGRVQA